MRKAKGRRGNSEKGSTLESSIHTVYELVCILYKWRSLWILCFGIPRLLNAGTLHASCPYRVVHTRMQGDFFTFVRVYYFIRYYTIIIRYDTCCCGHAEFQSSQQQPAAGRETNSSCAKVYFLMPYPLGTSYNTKKHRRAHTASKFMWSHAILASY